MVTSSDVGTEMKKTLLAALLGATAIYTPANAAQFIRLTASGEGVQKHFNQGDPAPISSAPIIVNMTMTIATSSLGCSWSYNCSVGPSQAYAQASINRFYVLANLRFDGSSAMPTIGTFLGGTFLVDVGTIATRDSYEALLTSVQIEYVDLSGFPNPPVTYSILPGVPEPASWALMIAGFGLAGGAMRRRSNLLRSI